MKFFSTFLPVVYLHQNQPNFAPKPRPTTAPFQAFRSHFNPFCSISSLFSQLVVIFTTISITQPTAVLL
jgi:hypothetical protein